MGYKGVVKGNLIILEEGIALPEGIQVEVTPIEEQKGTPAALLEVWGSDIPNDGWDIVEKAIEDLDCSDREHERNQPHV